MPATDYSDINAVLKALRQDQEAEFDNRERVREAQLFLHAPDGQWDPYLWDSTPSDRPRYTFDMTGPLIDQIVDTIESSEFAAQIDPADSAATEDVAEIFQGIIRNIEQQSQAQTLVYNPAARKAAGAGLDGWRLVQKYLDDDCFDQDLAIERISNFEDRVWFSAGSVEPDARDAKHVFVLSAMPKAEYEERYPEEARTGVSVGDDRAASAYYHKAETVIVGQIYYLKQKKRTLGRLSTGQVFDVSSEEFQRVQDELAALGVTVSETRERPQMVVYSRTFDGGAWLTDEQETVFTDRVPVFPVYAEPDVLEHKIVYKGAVERLKDPQRVYNYSKSREIEEGAYAPRAKYWMTQTQVEGYEDELATLNTNSDPVQRYNSDPTAPPPTLQGGAVINPGLQALGVDMREQMLITGGMYSANMGDNPGLQSGVAIDNLQAAGRGGNSKYVHMMEVAIEATARAIVKAAPKVYTGQRMIRTVGEDGAQEFVQLRQPMLDQQTGQIVRLNNLDAGQYLVRVSAGQSYKNRQQETVSVMTQLGAVDPSILEMGSDILLQNITAPGMDKLAERKRMQLLAAGLIPPEQMTDEERQMMAQQQAAAQNQGPDPATLVAQAELMKAQNQQMQMQVKAQEAQGKQGIEAAKLQENARQFDASQQMSAQQFQQEMLERIAKLELEYKKDVNGDGAIGEVPPIRITYDPFTGIMGQ